MQSSCASRSVMRFCAMTVMGKRVHPTSVAPSQAQPSSQATEALPRGHLPEIVKETETDATAPTASRSSCVADTTESENGPLAGNSNHETPQQRATELRGTRAAHVSIRRLRLPSPVLCPFELPAQRLPLGRPLQPLPEYAAGLAFLRGGGGPHCEPKANPSLAP